MRKMMRVSSGRTRRALQALDRFCLLPQGATYTCGLCLRNPHKNNNNKPLHQQYQDNENEEEEDYETNPLILQAPLKPMKLKDMIASGDYDPNPTLAFHLKPKKVVLRVSMHCGGCARKVEKHISKIQGVSWYEVDLESKMVVVTGDIVPLEVLHSVSKVKNAQLWNTELCP